MNYLSDLMLHPQDLSHHSGQHETPPTLLADPVQTCLIVQNRLIINCNVMEVRKYDEDSEKRHQTIFFI